MSLIELALKYGIKISGVNVRNTKKFIAVENSGSLAPKEVLESLRDRVGVEDFEKTRDPNFEQILTNEVREMEEKKKKKNPVNEKLLEGMTLYKDCSFTFDREPRYFLGNAAGRMSRIPAHAYIDHHQIKDPQNRAIPAIPEYSPQGDFGEYEKKIVTGETLVHVNTYIPPKWKDYEGDLPDELPQDFQRLINHIFPKQIDRDYFFHWVYRSLTFRAETYLILQGDGGIGKNRLKIALRALHGNNNAADGKRTTITGNFNSQIADNTLLYFDEFKFGEAEENVMKEIPNNTISIEGKFKDSTKNTKVFCSLVLANNKEKDNYILYDARKFTPLELTKENLNVAMSNEEIDAMTKKMEFEDRPEYDVKYVAQIGRWILKHGEDPRWPTCEYKGPRFWTLAYTSTSAWKKSLLAAFFSGEAGYAAILSKHVFNYSEILKQFNKEAQKARAEKIKVDASIVENFLNIYRDLEGNKIFETKKIPGNLSGDFTIKILQNPVLFIPGNSQKDEERPEDLL